MAPCGCTCYFIVAPLAICMLAAFVFSDGAKDIRLVGGSLPNEGRIEVFFEGVWHTICSNQATWTTEKSEVVCRQLGYAGHVNEIYDGYFGEGSGFTINDPLDCSGDEKHIRECRPTSPQDTISCDHSEDMSTICRLPGYLGCFNPDVNITGHVTREVNISLTVVTPINCIEACQDINMSYTVVMATGCQCIESSALVYDEAGGGSGTCAEPCPDNNHLYFCGGASKVDIYKTGDVICPDPGIPLNGDRQGNRFYFGDQVLFSCEEGYTLVGTSTAQCILGGNNTVEWDSAVPLCNLDLVTAPTTVVSSTAYPETSFQSPTITEDLNTDQAPLTDFNDSTTNLMTSSDVKNLNKPASPTTNTLGYVINLTSPWEFPLSKNNGAVTSITGTPTGVGGTSIVTKEKLSSMSTNQPTIESSTQRNPISSQTMLKIPTDDGQRAMSTPTQSLPGHEDPKTKLTTTDGERTVPKLTITAAYYTSTETLQTVSEGLSTEISASDRATVVSSTEYPESSFQSPTIAEHLNSDQAPLTDFNDGTTNLMTSSDVTNLNKPASPTTNTLGYVISLTSPWEFPLSKNNGAVTSITETPTGVGGTSIVTKEKFSSMSTNQPTIESSTQRNPISSQTMLKLPTDDGQRAMSTPTQSLPGHEDPGTKLTTTDGERTVPKLTITAAYYTSTETLQTVSEGLSTEISGGTVFRLILILALVIIVLTILLVVVMVIICCIWRCRREKPIFRVASATESDMRSSFVFSRGSDSYKRFGQQRLSANAKPDVVTMGTTFGHDDTDTSNYYHNATYVEPGYDQQMVDPFERDVSHSEAVGMFRQSRGDIYNQFDFEVPTENEIIEEEDMQLPSSFLEDDFIKQSTV